jgi:hypothetical protein
VTEYSLNVLPVLMTLINCVAGAVYTKGLPLKEKVQLYGMAAVFLVLLYNSPSGLVVYWTMNNIISLIKNCLQKVKSSKKIVYVFLGSLILLLDVYVIFFHPGPFGKKILFVVITSVVFFAPVLIKLLKFAGRKINVTTLLKNISLVQNRIFVCSMAVLFLLAGLVIPGSLVASSVQEFSFIENYTSPFPFIGNTLLQAAGIFLLWPLCFYLLSSNRVKGYLAVAASFICVSALVNTFLFPGNYGFLTTMLVFSNSVEPPFYIICMNIILLFLAAVLSLGLLFSPRKIFYFSLQLVLLISLMGFGAIHLIKIHREYSLFASRGIAETDRGPLDPEYSFSREGKNVLIIMLDRGISGFVPAIFEEKPELKESYTGFTYYPNCISFGGFTLFGAPGIYGGYEYTPLEMQRRSSESLLDKHDEALLVLPKMFLDNGYEVTVTDPPFAGYGWWPDLHAFSDYPEIHVRNMLGNNSVYKSFWQLKHMVQEIPVGALLKNNLIRFSFFRILPVSFRGILYDTGWWFNYHAVGFSETTMCNYAVLDILPDITEFNAESKNHLIMMTNNLTHEPEFLQYPGYVPVSVVTDRGSGSFSNESHYHVNMASYLLLGKWFSFLKENGVYDNTRIIIVSDHGRNLFNDFPNNIVLPNDECVEAYNALLLVKDFGADGDLVTDNVFMTNVDVPYLATEDTISNPANPFTNALIQKRKEHDVVITTSGYFDPSHHGKYLFNIKKDEWLRVHDNIFNPDNWEKVDP